MKPNTFVDELPAQTRGSRLLDEELRLKLMANPGKWYYLGNRTRLPIDRALNTYARDWRIEMKTRNNQGHKADVFLRYNA